MLNRHYRYDRGMYDIIIIGGGASALFLAANITDTRVLLLEKTAQVGNKLRITGGGMCNLTNCDEPDRFLIHFGSPQQRTFLKPALMNLSPAATQVWFTERGVPLTVREDGKVFPRSLDARTVISMLKDQAQQNGVEITCDAQVTEVSVQDQIFTVRTAARSYQSLQVVIATGGMSYPATGSDGSGYALARSLGHTIIEPTQALTSLVIKDYGLSELSGNSIRDSHITCFHEHEQRRYLQADGDLLFTHKGLSGPVILNSSRHIRTGDLITASLFPSQGGETAREEMHRALLSDPKKQVSTILKSYGLIGRLIEHLLDQLQLSRDVRCAELSKKDRTALVQLLAAYPFTVSRKGYFSSSMVTAGGVSLAEVQRTTMGSRIVPGLFLAGEVLDIDGDTGGYNLQAAFSTAKLIADHFSRTLVTR